jgi:hypothetical protein
MLNMRKMGSRTKQKASLSTSGLEGGSYCCKKGKNSHKYYWVAEWEGGSTLCLFLLPRNMGTRYCSGKVKAK